MHTKPDNMLLQKAQADRRCIMAGGFVLVSLSGDTPDTYYTLNDFRERAGCYRIFETWLWNHHRWHRSQNQFAGGGEAGTGNRGDLPRPHRKKIKTT